MKKFSMVLLAVMLLTLFASVTALADGELTTEEPFVTTAVLTEEKAAADTTNVKAIIAGAMMAVAAAAGAIAMAMTIGKATEGMARQPEAGSDIRSSMMLGLIFIETAIIYALIVAILIIFVL